MIKIPQQRELRRVKNVSENGGAVLASLGMLGVLFGEAGLLIDPTTRLAAGPVLCREAFGFVGLDGTGILEAVHLLAHLAIGMLEVTNVVDSGVADDDGGEPPEGQGGEALLGLAEEAKHNSIDGELFPSGSLEGLHQTRLRTVRLGLHGPTTARVVDGDAPGRVDDA